jgi:hypothetical protein
MHIRHPLSPQALGVKFTSEISKRCNTDELKLEHFSAWRSHRPSFVLLLHERRNIPLELVASSCASVHHT